MADDIIQFAPGGKVTAEETNENNLLLKEWALDNSQGEAYIDGKIATLTSNLNSQISSLNSQIATKAPLANPTLTGTVKVPNNAAVGTAIATAAISKTSNGYVKLGNGLIVQWGRVNISSDTSSTITFPTAFSSSTSYTIIKNYQSSHDTEARDREVSFYSQTATKATTWSSKADTNGFSWLAIGY